MIPRLLVIAFALASAIGASDGPTKTLRFAFQGGLNSLDPYALNETFSQGILANVMEGLIKRDQDLRIVPGLAERWETLDPTHWRFHLRKGVKFHDGSPFTADDVVFSAERARGPGSQIKARIPADAKVVKVDDHTVDFILTTPNPILHYEWETWLIFSKSWSEANGAANAERASATSLSPAALKANGTGPFTITSHEPGVRTVFKRNPNWWGTAQHNVGEVVFQTVASDATRVAALLSGDLDLMDPVPVQDVERIKQSPIADVMVKPELRTIFLNMDSFRDELLYSSVKGKNPFKDARVRKAFYQAIDIETIKTKIMRGQSEPAALIIAPLLFSQASQFHRWPYDPAASRRLMAEAGYAQGFELGMDCPNDRYVSDEEICQAVAAMLGRIGVKVSVNALPKAKYFEKAGPKRYDSSFNLLGWTPSSLESYGVLSNLLRCRDKDGKGGTFNFGGYCNPQVDALIDQILVESDTAKRDDLITEAFRLVQLDVGAIPLHQQSLAWGVSRKINVVQRADNQIRFETIWMQ
jgi:peptide/nickel transport system substrate-binding protein